MGAATALRLSHNESVEGFLEKAAGVAMESVPETRGASTDRRLLGSTLRFWDQSFDVVPGINSHMKSSISNIGRASVMQHDVRE